MASQLPYLPNLVFTKIEPVSLLAGLLGPVLGIEYFITSQMDFTYGTLAQTTVLNSIVAKDATTQLIALQLGNCYGLLGLLGVLILNTTTELRVVHAYLWALWVGDIGHVGLNLWALGWNGISKIGEWNTVAWANIGFTMFLFAMRSAYFAGLFGGGTQGFSVEPKKVKSRALKNE